MVRVQESVLTPPPKCKDKVDEPSALQGLGRAGGPSLSTFLCVDSKPGLVHIGWETQLYQESDLVNSHFEEKT